MYKILLFVLSVTVFGSILIYIQKTHQYPEWDEHHYLTIAVKTLDAIHKKGLLGVFDSISISGSRQPVYPILITLLLLIFGTEHTYKLALGINALLFVVTILGTYTLARHFLKKLSSFMATLLAATYGNALFYVHFTYVETAVTAGIIWSIIALLKTNRFTNNKWTIVAGFLTATATLTRFIAPVFLLGPILCTFPLQQHSNKTKKQLVNAGIFFLLAVGIPLFFYFIPNHQAFLQYVHDNQTYGAQWVAEYRDASMANTFSTHSVMYYFNILQQNTIIPFFLFMCGFLISVINIFTSAFYKKSLFSLETSYYLLAAFFIPYSFLTFITIWKEDRFLVSIYPIVALISAVFIEQIMKFRKIRITFITVILGISVINFIGALFAIGPAGKKGLVDYVTPRWIPHPRRFYLTPLVWPPTKEYAHADILVQTILTDWKNTNLPVVGFNFHHEPFINAITSILSYEKRNTLTLLLDQTATNAGQLDYIVTSPEIDETKKLKKISAITIPYDNSIIYLYKNVDRAD